MLRPSSFAGGQEEQPDSSSSDRVLGPSSLVQAAPGVRNWSNSSTPRDGDHAASLPPTSASNLHAANRPTSTMGGRVGEGGGRSAAVGLTQSILDLPLQQQQQLQGQVGGFSRERRPSHGDDAASVSSASQRPPSPSLRPLSIEEVLRRPSPST
eukprot:scaffold5416_cov17-Tisochrysis_lutea.AAC.2